MVIMQVLQYIVVFSILSIRNDPEQIGAMVGGSEMTMYTILQIFVYIHTYTCSPEVQDHYKNSPVALLVISRLQALTKTIV